MRATAARLRWIYLVPILILVALTAWGLASPMGSSPDDDFHLASAWCASINPAAGCEEGTAANNREVPEILLKSACYLPSPATSAGCQARLDFDVSSTELSQRGNFVGGYPPVFYAVMGLFATPDVVSSVLVMRLVNALIFVALTSTLFVLLPAVRRPTLVWAWLVTTLPLGLFLIPSNNPSSWAIMGAGCAWIALLGYFETTGRRRLGLGILFALATIIAGGARGDGAIYSALGIAVVLGLTFRLTRRYIVQAILPILLFALCVYFFISAQQVVSGLNGFGGVGSSPPGVPREQAGLLAYNLLNVPKLWAGVFGSWGLGWLEVAMPAIVAFGSLACFVGVAFVGFAKLTGRKAIALAIVGASLIVLPVVVLTRGGDLVGEEVQPRYLLPLIVLFAGLLLLKADTREVTFSRGQAILIASTLSVIQFVALHTTMRRYLTGDDNQGLNLNAEAEWWWNIPVSPMVVLIVGSIAFAGAVWILVREILLRPPVSNEAA